MYVVNGIRYVTEEELRTNVFLNNPFIYAVYSNFSLVESKRWEYGGMISSYFIIRDVIRIKSLILGFHVSKATAEVRYMVEVIVKVVSI